MGGLSVGILSGLVVAIVGLAAVSLSTPLPPREEEMATEVAAPAPDVEEAADTPELEDEVPAPDADAAEAEPETDDPEPTPQDVVAAPEAEAAIPAPEAEAEAEDDVPAGSTAPATEIPLPSGTEFNRPPPEPEAALPSAETAPQSSAPQAPALAGDGSAPTFDTSPAAQPAVGADAPAGLALTADPGAAPASPALGAAPAASPEPVALSQPDASASPTVDTALPAPVEPVVVEEEVAVEEAPAVEEDVVAAPADTAPQDAEAVAPLADAPVEPEAVPLATPRFPTIGEDSAALPQTPEAPADEGPLPAIRAFAADFDADDARPLMAVVLIDEPDSRIEVSTLTRFSFPVAFAVDPLHPDAASRAALYREAGFEVVILASMIAEGATAADVEVALQSAQVTLPEAVAVLDTPEDRIQADRPVLDAVVGALSETGHGLVAFPRGLNAAEQSANRVGVPGATVFRMLDDDDQRATVITRFLGRAAFTAGQEGAVIVVGRTRPDTVTALFSWALGGRSEGVVLAPLSATIERAAGG